MLTPFVVAAGVAGLALWAAARWFRRTLREAATGPGLATLVRKELIELYVHRLAQPERAAPELARMADELAGTPEAEWATRELATVKARMAERSGEG